MNQVVSFLYSVNLRETCCNVKHLVSNARLVCHLYIWRLSLHTVRWYAVGRIRVFLTRYWSCGDDKQQRVLGVGIRWICRNLFSKIFFGVESPLNIGVFVCKMSKELGDL